MLSVLSMILISAGLAMLLFLGVHAAVIFVKAKKSGIVRTVYTAERKKLIVEFTLAVLCLICSVTDGVIAYSYRAYINEMDSRGLAAIADHRGVSVDELSNAKEVKPAYLDAISDPVDYQKACEREKDRFISHERHRYSQSAAHHIDLMIVYFVISIVYAVSALTHRAFFTEDGIYVLDKPDTSPLKAYARVSGKYLCFYEKSVPNRHLISVKATDENLEAYKSFFVPEGYRICY